MVSEKKTRTVEETSDEVDETVPAGDTQAQAVSEVTDDLLDEIDSVLEENAAEFVKSYVQKGGQ